MYQSSLVDEAEYGLPLVRPLFVEFPTDFFLSNKFFVWKQGPMLSYLFAIFFFGLSRFWTEAQKKRVKIDSTLSADYYNIN